MVGLVEVVEVRRRCSPPPLHPTPCHTHAHPNGLAPINPSWQVEARARRWTALRAAFVAAVVVASKHAAVEALHGGASAH